LIAKSVGANRVTLCFVLLKISMREVSFLITW